jgi:PAS domain S-box-containing protein
MFKRNFLVLLTVLLTYGNIFSQNYSGRISNITVKDGLSHNNVYALTQDSQGFMWIGTQNGLDKYDGYNFLSYYHDPSDSTTLISANFGKLFTDSKKRIWIGTYTGGVSCYIPEQNKIYHFINNPKNPKSLSSDLIRHIREDKEGNIWISTNNGLNKFIEKDRTFIRYFNKSDNENSLSSNNITEFCFDDDGSIWVGTNNGLNKFDPKTGKCKRYFSDNNNSNSISSNFIQSLFIDNEGKLWIGTRETGLNLMDGFTGNITRFENNPQNPKSVGDNRIQTIFQDSYGTIWIGTYSNGLSIYDPFTKTFSHIVHNHEQNKGLNNNTVEVIFEDNAGNLWIGTRGGGIDIIDLKPQKFYNIVPLPNDNTLPDPIVQAIIQENDSIIWFGTKAGLSKYNLYNDTYSNLVHKETGNSIANDRILSLLKDKRKNIWTGTYGGGLIKITYQNGSYNFTNFNYKKDSENSLSSNQVNALLEDKSGNIWVGTGNGVDKISFDIDGNYVIENYVHDKNDENTISHTYITYFFQDKKNNIWICTSMGLSKYNPKTNSFIRYNNTNSNKKDLDINSFTYICQDSQNDYWTGTNGGGLYKFDPEKGTFQLFSDGTSKSGSIMGILEDSNKNLWISTQKGITKFNIINKSFINYDISDGLSESGFSRNACVKTTLGDLYFGSISGYTIISPEKIKPNSNKPKVVLTDFKIFNKSIFKNRNSLASKNPSYLTEVNLSYSDYVFSFDFSALDFTNTSKNKYSYQIEGFNKDWIEFGNQHNIMLTSLPPGNYTLLIKASNNDGVWCDDSGILKIKIYVKPPFWKTWWFYSILVSLALIAVYFSIVIRTRNLKQKNLILEQKVQKRTLQLEESNKELEKLSVVARETDNSVTILAADGELIWINEGFSKIFGYKNIDEFKEKMGNNILTGNFSNDIINAVNEVIITKKTLVSKFKVVDKYNADKWLQTVWTPILDENNNLIQIISVDSDITEIIKAEHEIINQKNILEEKNAEINKYNENLNSSIRYALTIQESILPFKKQYDEFADNFIIYIPKDIVSGDFYWYAETDEYHFSAVVDCTGHGVPGAFMSLIASRLLNKIVKDNNVTNPSEILEFLDAFVISTLKQHETGNRDGMDVGICRVSKNKFEGKTEILFAGAKQDLLLYQKSENSISRIRGTRKAIGGTGSKRNTEQFFNFEYLAEKGDTLYLMTDGYKDQNNKKRDRFGTSRLIVLLEQTMHLSMENQKEIITDILEKFKEGEKNRDDITILSLRFR